MKEFKEVKRYAALALLAVAVLFCGLASFKSVEAQAPGKSNLTRVVGSYDSTNYQYWGGEIVSGNSATGSQTIVIATNNTLPDGRFFQPLLPANGVFAPILIDAQAGGLGTGGPAETVTPTAVSALTPCPANTPTNQLCYSVTASFSYTHGPSLNTSQVISGDQGIQEAINDASLNGGGDVYFQADTGTVTLNTGGATTTTTAMIPTGFFVGGASCRVTTTITTAASYSLGISGATTALVNASTQLTAGNVQQVTFLGAGGTKVGTTVVPGAALTALLITANATPGAGAMHCRAWGHVPAQSNF